MVSALPPFISLPHFLTENFVDCREATGPVIRLRRQLWDTPSGFSEKMPVGEPLQI
jgi:hypothetical protein